MNDEIDWVQWDWDGRWSDSPIPLTAPYKIQFRGIGSAEKPQVAGSNRALRWTHQNTAGDIISFSLPRGVRPLHVASLRYPVVEALLWRDG